MDILDSEVRPFNSLEHMKAYAARGNEFARKYGQIVKAAEISNRDYRYRYSKFSMFLGYLGVRNLGTSEQYETWMPNHVFNELYEVASGPELRVGAGRDLEPIWLTL